MRKNLLPIILSLFALGLSTILFFNLYFNPTTPDIPQTSIVSTNIKRWYGTEGPRYTIFKGGTIDMDIYAVLDKEKNLLLAPDESCEVPIPKDYKMPTPTAHFYNSSVGIKVEGPYKYIYPKKGTDSTFTQSLQSGGCAIGEGEITISTDEERMTAKCKIKIEYEDLGCD